ncbi:AAA-ATPase ASD, mitochondrial, partial [Linum grandiflorum]
TFPTSSGVTLRPTSTASPSTSTPTSKFPSTSSPATASNAARPTPPSRPTSQPTPPGCPSTSATASSSPRTTSGTWSGSGKRSGPETGSKLYTNSSGHNRWLSFKQNSWSHIPFEHPATFETMAMDPVLKKEIIEDLLTFTESRDFYSRIGKAWKRGYLLYGPPGTGKSTMIAAMANLLSYDVYDLELTAVRDNTELRKLLIDTTSKSIIVIEDIDCSLDLTGQRKTKLQNGSKLGFDEIESLIEKHRNGNSSSRVTLSGLLNFIDGLWSSSGGERLIVFTTNHVEKLDPALIRRGRMDKHVELSYCSFEAFRVLAWNYLRLQDHPMFSEVDRLIKEINITPADVAENLMLKSPSDDSARCLSRLIAAMEEVKEDAAAAVKPEMEAALVKENDGSGSFLGDKEHGFQMPWPDIEVDSQIIATDFTGI